MLQEKLEEQARQLATLSGQNNEEGNNLRRRANELEEDQIQVDSEAAEDKEKAEAFDKSPATEIEESQEESKEDSDNEGFERRGTIIKVAGNTDEADEGHNELQAQEEEKKKEQKQPQEQEQIAKDNEN